MVPQRVTDKYFEKKLDFESYLPSATGNVSYHYNAWVTGVFVAYLFDRNSGRKASQIEWLFESNLRSSGYFKCSTSFGLHWTPAAKATCLQDLAGHFRSRLSPDAQNRTFAKNGSCNQILDMTLLLSHVFWLLLPTAFIFDYY